MRKLLLLSTLLITLYQVLSTTYYLLSPPFLSTMITWRPTYWGSPKPFLMIDSTISPSATTNLLVEAPA